MNGSVDEDAGVAARATDSLLDRERQSGSDEILTLKKPPSGLVASAFRSVSIEPVMFLHMLGFTMTTIITQDLYLERICRVELGYPADSCQQLLANTGNKTIEEEVDARASKYSLYRSFESLVPILFAIFLGPWSDKHGSKIPLLLPLFGYVLSAGCYTLMSFLTELPPLYLLLASIPISLSGGMVALVLSALSYISNVTTNENRSFRLAVLEACWFFGSPIGTLAGAKLYKYLGFPPIFIIAATCYTVALCYGMVFLRNDKAEPYEETSNNCFTDMFNVDAVKDIVRAVFARRVPPRRLWLICLVIVITANVMTSVGSAVCLFLYTRHQFNWNEQNYSTYSTVNSFLGTLGIVLMTTVGLKILKLSDSLVAICSTLSCITAGLIIAFAPEDPKMSWMMYLASAIQMFGGMTTIMTRSMFSKIVSKEEVAKIFTFISCIEVATIPMAASTLYSTIYMTTQKHFPGAFSAVNAGANGLNLMILMYLYFSMRRAPDVLELTEEDEDEDHRAIN